MHNFLHQCRHAYQAERSTKTVLYQLMDMLRQATETKEIVLCTFMDNEGVFYNIKHTQIQDALIQGSGKYPGFLDGENVRGLTNRTTDRHKLYCHEYYSTLPTEQGTVTAYADYDRG